MPAIVCTGLSVEFLSILHGDIFCSCPWHLECARLLHNGNLQLARAQTFAKPWTQHLVALHGPEYEQMDPK